MICRNDEMSKLKEGLFQILAKYKKEVVTIYNAIKRGKFGRRFYERDKNFIDRKNCLISHMCFFRKESYGKSAKDYALTIGEDEAVHKWFRNIKPGDTPSNSHNAWLMACFIEDFAKKILSNFQNIKLCRVLSTQKFLNWREHK